MQETTAKVDRQATSLLDITLGSNVIVILIIIGINIVNLVRANSGQSALVNAAAPGLVVIVSLALVLYLLYGCWGAFTTRRRLGRVFIMVDENGVSGMSLANPTTGEQPQPFSVPFAQIRSVSVDGVALTKKHTVLALKLETEDRAYFVPAPEGLKELVQLISDHMVSNPVA